MHSGEDSNMAAMAPAWFTQAMAGVNQQLQILGPMQSDIQSITTSLNFLGEEVNDAKTSSAAALARVKILEIQLSDQQRINAELRKDLEKANKEICDSAIMSRKVNLNFEMNQTNKT